MVSQPIKQSFWEFETPLGWIAVAGAKGLLERVTFGHFSRIDCLQAIGAMGLDDRFNWHPRLVERLIAFANGCVDDFLDIELAQFGRTPFQLAVIKHCRRIPAGETRSYAELARRAGNPGAARAVGSVMAGNRCPLVVPCHRVVRADGVLGNFSAPGGATFKRRLLDHEATMCSVR